MSMRWIKLILSIFAATAILNACGPSGATPEPTKPPAGQATQATAPTQAPVATQPSAATSVPAPTQAAAAQPKTLRFVWLGDLNPLWHPAGYTTFGQSVIFSLIFNNLVKLDADLKTIVPDLADRWDVTPDASVYTFYLHKGVKWQDGSPFTAKDVVFSFSRQIAEPYRFVKFMDAIKGAKEFKDGTASSVAGLEALDDNTVRITLSAPDAIFLLNLSEPTNVIVPEHLLKDVKPDAIESAPFTLKSPVGTGPYKFVQYQTDQYVELDVNPDYFKGKPQIDKIFMKRLQDDVTVAQLESGEVDLALRLNPADYDRLSKVSTVNIITGPGVGQTALNFPVEQPRVSDKRVRQAIYYAIDRKGIVQAVYQGRARVSNGVTPAMDVYSDLNPYDYNPDKAKQLLQDAGFDFKAPFRIIYDQTYPAAGQYYPLIGQQLQKAGINVELNAMDSTAFLDRQTKQRNTWEVAGYNGGSWGLGAHITAQYFNCKRPGVTTGYLNCALDDLFVKASTIADPKQRDEVYHQAAKILNEDLPILSLWTANDLHAATKRLGGGFKTWGDPRRSFTKIETWTLQ